MVSRYLPQEREAILARSRAILAGEAAALTPPPRSSSSHGK